jgi:hypothetical protein
MTSPPMATARASPSGGRSEVPPAATSITRGRSGRQCAKVSTISRLLTDTARGGLGLGSPASEIGVHGGGVSALR